MKAIDVVIGVFIATAAGVLAAFYTLVSCILTRPKSTERRKAKT